MDVREKLVELMDASRKYVIDTCQKNHFECDNCVGKVYDNECGEFLKADYLLANGVTVQELDGCKYCRGEFIGEIPIFTLGNDCGIDSIVEDEFLYIFCDCGTKSIVKINFCPMCGRRLPKPPKGELG